MASDKIRTYLRVRPLATASDATVNTLKIQPTQKANDVPTTIRTYPPAKSNAAKVVRTSDTRGGVKEFQFSQVFGPHSSQQDIYTTIAAPLVTSLFLGESGLLFTYGITNSGKTHTIMGNVKDKQANQKWGIIPRALQDIFAHMESSKTAYNLNLSYMEIYNGDILDLLPQRNNNAALTLRESSDGQIVVRGLEKHCVKNVAHGLKLAEQAGNKRHTSSNKINSNSSRSHCICQLELVVQTTVHPAAAKDDNENEKATADACTMDEEASHITRTQDKTVMLWIVDLAGSERSKRTGAVHISHRQKEANKINLSLSALKQCLSAMQRNQSLSSKPSVLVPFRDSKLTHLFKNHLTGPSAKRTVMVVNVNPAEADFDETQHVLAYTTEARTIKISQEEGHQKRKKMEATHDYNGRALKRYKSSKEPVLVATPALTPKPMPALPSDEGSPCSPVSSSADEMHTESDWGTNRGGDASIKMPWEQRFEELVEFKDQNNHCLVPKRYKLNPALGNWVRKQRPQYKLFREGQKSTMTEERVKKLEDMGFKWKARSNMTWAQRFEELVEFIRQNNHCLVPYRYKLNPALGNWVRKQRPQYKLFREGQKSTMTEEHVQMLEDIGFKWVVPNRTSVARHKGAKSPE